MQGRELDKATTRLWVAPVALTVAGALIGLLIASVLPRAYTSQSELYFSASGGESLSELNDAATFVRAQMPSYAQLATAGDVLERVAGEVQWQGSMESLAKRVSGTVPVDSFVLRIDAEGGSPAEAAQLANAVARYVADYVVGASPRSAQGATVVNASLVTRAVDPAGASSPNHQLIIGGGAFLGLLIGGAVAATLRWRERGREVAQARRSLDHRGGNYAPSKD